ncbi:hypothetical protein [Hyphomicrobium sp.]|jgi:hypothetical protein|uniref:hypothetical protein n=1 Tax=Hyphomicrobium sp. TaxID=82 RepID=UPI002B924CD0|nr:hypothetical protein [Hyphomicrobium sp.]HVZ06239.1 hypothetical protein [Hyphomicrobium sp.]
MEVTAFLMGGWDGPVVQLEIPGLPAVEGPPKKRCSSCFSVKVVSEFSRDRSQRDGHSRICRQCDSEQGRERRREKGDLIRVRERRRYAANPYRQRQKAAQHRRSDRGKAINLLAVRRYRERNEQKYQAHIRVRHAIAAGTLVKADRCEFANLGGCAGRIEAHHEDYDRPLDVRWLCVEHHNERHHKPRTYSTPTPLFDFEQALGEPEPPFLEASE